MVWTVEHVTTLRTMWAEGAFASRIALVLGITRNAVIGKVNRLGLEKRKHAVPSKSGSARPLSAALHNKPDRLPRPRKVPCPGKGAAPKADLIHINDNAIPFEQRRSLSTIKDSECHFPVGDPLIGEFFYCGGPAHGDRPYCLAHQRRMFSPPRPRPVARLDQLKAVSVFRIHQA